MITWHETIESFKGYLTLEKALSVHSVGAYLNDVNKLALYFTSAVPVVPPDEVTRPMLLAYLATLSDSGVNARSQARSVSGIKAFFKYLVYDGKLQATPAEGLETPKCARPLPTVLSVEEIEAMINAVDLDKPEGQRDKAIIETLYSCGLRVSELSNLKLSNIHFRAGIIKVEGKGNKERFVPLNTKAKDEIRIYVNTARKELPKNKKDEDTLFLNRFGKKLSRVSVFNIIKYLTLKAGINKVVSPHTLRHSFASHLVNGGADIRAVQDMLGHESILTTEIYTHLDNAFLRDAIVNYHPRAKKKGKREK
ncbi:MAG: tyrosine recombinase XerD [Odoribacteraceae bacterium]|jgi:integrase/recombinase XerD|nr:tyrosine recombinase XerD [Odoribacteraceae bacterium]